MASWSSTPPTQPPFRACRGGSNEDTVRRRACIDAPAMVVYHCLVDYRAHHRPGGFLPPAFEQLEIARGGVGAACYGVQGADTGFGSEAPDGYIRLVNHSTVVFPVVFFEAKIFASSTSPVDSI